MVVSLPHGLELIIDDEDYEKISMYRWYAIFKNKDLSRPRAVMAMTPSPNRKTLILHRVLMGNPKNMMIDHINGNPLDNRRENLRVCTNKENTRNSKRHRNGSSGLKGAHRTTYGKWISQIKVDGENIYLGTFDEKESAHMAYREAATKYFGEFARFE